ncbi:MAG: mechanosensitive ion channel family protein [Clostridium sp.]|nr:mechanosensitive ion channel family protein [Clostridium sp.]
MTGSLHFAEPVATTLSTVLVILLAGAFTITAIHINHFIFYRVLRMKAVHQKFMYSLINCAFIITGLMLLGKFVGVSGSLERVLLGSTGLFVAIIGFAAQSVIGDIVAGFMLSVCRPFALGDRVVLQNAGITGTVRDMTIRHTVIHCFDGLYVVVPNSVMNSEILHNNSYQNSLTGSYLEFCIGYDSDIPTAMKIIHDAVIACKYTVEYAGDNPEGRRAAVYITEFADSCVKLRTTVWARNSDENFMACSDIMLRVKNNFNIYGVEIPYNYVNVVNREYAENKDVRTLSTKNIYSDNVVEVRKSVQSFCDAYNIKDRNEQQLTLLAEELFNVMGQYTKKESYFNILMNRNTCEMHLRILSDVNYEDKKSLYALSTMDTSWIGIPDIIRNLIGSYKSGGIENNKWSLSKYKADVAQGDVSQKDIGKSILTALSDDIQVTAKNGMIEIVIYKKVR